MWTSCTSIHVPTPSSGVAKPRDSVVLPRTALPAREEQLVRAEEALQPAAVVDILQGRPRLVGAVARDLAGVRGQRAALLRDKAVGAHRDGREVAAAGV